MQKLIKIVRGNEELIWLGLYWICYITSMVYTWVTPDTTLMQIAWMFIFTGIAVYATLSEFTKRYGNGYKKEA